MAAAAATRRGLSEAFLRFWAVMGVVSVALAGGADGGEKSIIRRKEREVLQHPTASTAGKAMSMCIETERPLIIR